jgi:hypothetical protein
MTDDEELNADMIDALKKDLETMLPNFEEHLRKKYPMFVIYSSIFVIINPFLIEQIIRFERFIIIK